MWVWPQVPLGGSSPCPRTIPRASPDRPLLEHRKRGRERGTVGRERLWLEGRVSWGQTHTSPPLGALDQQGYNFETAIHVRKGSEHARGLDLLVGRKD